MKTVEWIRKSVYVNDVILSGDTLTDVKILRGETIEIFERAGFRLYEWHSNEIELEKVQTNKDDLSITDDESYAKQHWGDKKYAKKLLGLKREKHDET